MTELKWDQLGERRYETGVDHGVLYIPNAQGVYDAGYAWNGITSVAENPTGAESNPQYADNIKYLDLQSAEEFGATLSAFTYPDEFEQCDGSASPIPGVKVGQQRRVSFGLVYRTRIGNDLLGDDAGYKLHLAYGCKAAPTSKEYNTVNDSPEATPFSWEITTTAVEVPGLRPSATLTLDSTEVDATALAVLEDELFGTETNEPNLPTPTQVFELFGYNATPPAPAV